MTTPVTSLPAVTPVTTAPASKAVMVAANAANAASLAAAEAGRAVSVRAVAEEIRAVGHIEMDMTNYSANKKNPLYPDVAHFSSFYANIPDDYACIKMFFAINKKSITEKGVSLSDKYPKMFQLCLEIYNKGIEIGATLENEFNNMTERFKSTIIDLRDSDPIMAEMFKVELSAGTSAIGAFTLNFKEMTALIVTPGLTGGSTSMKEKFSNAINVLLRVLKGEEATVDISGFNDDIKKFFVLYMKLSPATKKILCDEFRVILTLFAKCVFIRRFPVAISGKLLFCSVFISDLQLRDIFAFLNIPVDNRLAICNY